MTSTKMQAMADWLEEAARASDPLRAIHLRALRAISAKKTPLDAGWGVPSGARVRRRVR